MQAIAYMPAPLRTPADIGVAIRSRRRALGWDQADLAERIGVSRLWVNQIEGGKPGAGLGRVLRAFAALGLTLSVAAPGEPDAEAETPEPVRTVDLGAVLDAARKKPPS